MNHTLSNGDKLELIFYYYNILRDELIKFDKTKNEVSYAIKDEDIKHAVNVFDYMINSEHENAFNNQQSQEITMALLSDLLQYLFEAIRNLEKKRVQIVYTLLRKPLKENLTYMEALASDSDFFKNFNHGDSNDYDINNMSYKNKKLMIKNVIEKMDYFIDYETIFDFRFNKRAEFSLEKRWNSSIHLVTSDRNYKTGNSNVNFIFIDEKSREEHVNWLYGVILLYIQYIYHLSKYLLEKHS